MNWSDGIDFEVCFWDRWFASQGGEWPDDYKRRLDPNLPLNPSYAALLDQFPNDPVRVLDVGAGPMTILGRKHPRKQMIITATDALAPQYDTLLEKYRVTPPVRTVYAPAEKLSEHFPANSFEFVHAQNSIDHCASPFEAVRQMLFVAKVGAHVRLNHAENEAENENYTGFHQWNFTVINGDFIVRGKAETINVTAKLRDIAKVTSQCASKWVTIDLQKLKDFSL